MLNFKNGITNVFSPKYIFAIIYVTLNIENGRNTVRIVFTDLN